MSYSVKSDVPSGEFMKAKGQNVSMGKEERSRLSSSRGTRGVNTDKGRNLRSAKAVDYGEKSASPMLSKMGKNSGAVA